MVKFKRLYYGCGKTVTTFITCVVKMLKKLKHIFTFCGKNVSFKGQYYFSGEFVTIFELLSTLCMLGNFSCFC